MNIVQRVLERYAASQQEDYLKSLLRIAKSGGQFASERQAAFLWKALNRREFKSPVADQWGKQYRGDDPNAYSVAIMVRDTRFGVRDISKIRYVAYLFVIDGAGVKAMTRGKVEHPKGGKGLPTLVGAEPTKFVRRGNAPVLYDHQAEKAAQRGRLEKNRPLIEKIQAVPGFNSNDFLQDMVRQLESGRQLSPAQLGVVRKFVPVDVGDASEWAKLYERGMNAIERNFIKPAVEFFKSDKMEDDGEAEWYLERVRDTWKKFKAKPQIEPEMGDFSTLNGLAEDVGIKKQRGVTGFGDAMARLGIAAKRGQKAPRTALKAIPLAQRYIEQFERLSPAKVSSWLENEFGGEVEDPFAAFK